MGDTPNSQPASPPPRCPVPRICHFHPFLGLPRCTEHRLIRVTVMEIIREERICKLISKLHQVCSANFSILLYSYICSSTPCLPPLFAFLLSACSPTPRLLRPPLHTPWPPSFLPTCCTAILLILCLTQFLSTLSPAPPPCSLSLSPALAPSTPPSLLLLLLPLLLLIPCSCSPFLYPVPAFLLLLLLVSC